MAWIQWARLVRIPTVFTILADVSAAYFLVAHGHDPLVRLLLVVLAGVCLYWSGMIFNDVFDIEVDRQERPGRPLPSGAISLTAARRGGSLLMISGLVLATLSGLAPAGGMQATWLPAVVAAALAIMILLYDGPLKQTPLGPVAMGSCRMLSFLLGASPILVAGGQLPATYFPTHVWVAAVGFGVYVMGVTLMARKEATENSGATLGPGLIVLILGCVLLALVPRMVGPEAGLRFRGDNQFAFLIGMLGITVVLRSIRLLRNPTPRRVQMTIRAALLTLIPLAAAFALIGAGPEYGLGVFCLIIPALLLSARFRMT